MNILGVGTNYFAFAGKAKVYVKALPHPAISNKGTGDDASDNGTLPEVPDIAFPSEWIAKDGHIECIAISNDDKLVAVGDSMHGVNLFKLESTEAKPQWLQIYSKVANKRVIKMEFTSDRQFLTFLDKQGDIYAIHIPEDQSKLSNIKKIMGHTSFISDYVTRAESKQIVSCDRDEKIRISNFPDAFVIQGFKLGHTESVINIAFLNVERHTFLLSMSLTGALHLWDFSKPINGTETDFLKTWNVKELLPEGLKEAGVKLMKAVAIEENAHVSVTFTGSTKVYVFQISMTSFKIDLLHELETQSENIITDWSMHDGTLIVYTPELGSIRHWKSGDNGLQSDKYDDLHETVISDMKASTESLKPPVVPMKKRLTTFEDATAALLQEQNAKKVKT